MPTKRSEVIQMAAKVEFLDRSWVASAFSVACAFFLILELDHPFGGLTYISSEPLTTVLTHLATVSRVKHRRAEGMLPLLLFQFRTALANRSRYMRR